MPKENILIGENGYIFEFTRHSGKINGRVPSGIVMVDGLGVGDVGNIVLRDRRQLSQDGILIVVITIHRESGKISSNSSDIVSRGFVYVRESEELMTEAKQKVQQILQFCENEQMTDWTTIKLSVKDTLAQYLFDKTRRRPMILPIIMEV